MKVVDLPKNKEFDQGTIFSCAVANNYEPCQVFGLVISARCDIAHAKIQHINYLPIVTFKDWLFRDFIDILDDRVSKQVKNELKELLQQKGFSPSVLEVYDFDHISTSLFKDSPNITKKDNDKMEKFKLNYKLLLDIKQSRMSNGFIDKSQYSLICLNFGKNCSKIVEECLSNKLMGFYFLPSIQDDDGECGYVVLMRQIQSISFDLIKQIVDGFDKIYFENILLKNFPSSEHSLKFLNNDDFAMPLSKLKSPNLEHLMQSFSLVFSRIGIDDLEKEYFENFWSRCKA